MIRLEYFSLFWASPARSPSINSLSRVCRSKGPSRSVERPVVPNTTPLFRLCHSQNLTLSWTRGALLPAQAHTLTRPFSSSLPPWSEWRSIFQDHHTGSPHELPVRTRGIVLETQISLPTCAVRSGQWETTRPRLGEVTVWHSVSITTENLCGLWHHIHNPSIPLSFLVQLIGLKKELRKRHFLHVQEWWEQIHLMSNNNHIYMWLFYIYMYI